MFKSKIVLYILAISVLFCSCSVSDSKTVTIGTFNIEWLGDGINDKKPRSEADYINIADVIKQTKAGLLVLQEIENETALKKILNYLPGYSYFISKAPGDQKLACIYRDDAKLNIEYIGDYFLLAFDQRLKPGMLLQIKINKKTIPVLALHLKSTSARLFTEEENREARILRYRQAIAVNRWADSVIMKAKQKELIILGDFNDYIKPAEDSPNTLLPLSANKNLVFLTKGMKSCKYLKQYTIDNIIVSKEMAKIAAKNSVRMYDINMTVKESQVNGISDHCPVLFDLEI